ncbi:MAG TPA: DUF84 family protein [Bacilli bacterium]|nr:DUF84 family protein [Bacilli bacterium]
MNKIYLGSLNAAKLQAVKEAIPGYAVIGIAVDSKVKCQPLDDAETMTGAYNRAIALPKDGLRIGLEAGVNMHENVMFLVNWGVLIDEEDKVYYAGGTRIPVPLNVKRGILEEGKELADVMAAYSDIENIREKAGAIGYFTCNQVTRSDIFVHIVKLLYGQYLHKEEGNKCGD